MRWIGIAALAMMGFQAEVASAQCTNGTELIRSFPTSGGAVSEWKICWAIQRMPDEGGNPSRSETLVLSEVTFRPGVGEAPVDVLGELRMAEVFVPYDAGQPRFRDMTEFDFELTEIDASDCTGTRLANDRICLEVLDRDLAWLYSNTSSARRGEKLVLWSVLDAANYDYLMSYAFWDDGTIEVRAGATGQKLGGPDDTAGHTHVFAWRIDLDVAGPGGDTVHVSNQSYGPRGVSEKETVVSKEAGIKWAATGFTHVEVEDATRMNGNGRPTGYSLEPMRSGLPTFRESWARNPFVVTLAPAAGEELRAVDLPTYLDKQPVAGQDIVLWYLDAHHHEEEMRDEDRTVVPVIWTQFLLVPQNLWDDTPFVD